MHRLVLRNGFERLALATLLALALLCAQAAGLHHAVAHADTQHAAALHDDGSADFGHSCESVEAAALGAGMPTPCYVPPLLPAGAVLALWLAFASWDAPLDLPFSSRAPPRL